MFNKVLIANRGEIAVRVMRACREMNIRSVAVYSDADRDARHTRYADEAYYLGPAPAAESYLRIERLIELARASGCEAIHPGYGFLAENAAFAQACVKSGVVFIGPNARAVALLGDKIASKKTMRRAGIPVIPGSDGAVAGEKAARRVAQDIGFPVLIKAAGGGGGKGMRVVHHEKDLAGAIKQAAGEAGSAFGDPTIFIEKFLDSPRHIEFQILADEQGMVLHLGERECSVQRRYQKLIEEAPSPLMTPQLRAQMGDAAVRAVRAAGYNNAGTVEFMVDKQRNFYFLEMNTRLQVEHPVTELVTGLDIVKEQFKIAAGEALTLEQERITMTGAAIECRISAEDPEHDFTPSVGEIVELVEPGGIGVRVDSGIHEGCRVSVHYDPLVAKLLAWAPTRAEAIGRMKRALAEYVIRGIKTTLPFHRLVMEHAKFIEGDYDTSFVDHVLGRVGPRKEYRRIAAVAAVLGRMLARERDRAGQGRRRPTVDPWKIAGRQAMMRKV